MKKQKTYKTKNNSLKAEEPLTTYRKNEIKIFNSFEEEAEYVALQSFNTSYAQRLKNLEMLRKQVFNQYLLPDGTWQPIKPIIAILKPYTNDIC
jgi:hypothetical protein